MRFSPAYIDSKVSNLLDPTSAKDATTKSYVDNKIETKSVAISLPVGTKTDLEIANGRADQAFARLIKCVRTLSGDEKLKAKEHLVLLFSLVDPADPFLIQARKDLASALF